jgi:hypothetical protein
MSIYFLTEFFKYFFRVLHETSSSQLKFGRHLPCIVTLVSLIFFLDLNSDLISNFTADGEIVLNFLPNGIETLKKYRRNKN